MLTTAVALHMAFPSLLLAVVMGLVAAAILPILMVPISLLVIVTSSSETVDFTREFLKWLGMVYVVLVGFAYLSGCALLILHHTNEFLYD